VYHVVRSLLEGLCDGDKIYHLEQRLANIHADMEMISDRILDKLDPEHAKEVSQLLNLPEPNLHSQPTYSRYKRIKIHPRLDSSR
jgi:hypothetical protein